MSLINITNFNLVEDEKLERNCSLKDYHRFYAS